jgi:hypothetical protein
MKALVTITSLLICSLCFAQDKGDHKIIVTLTDTTDAYNKVKVALVGKDFVVKDNGNRDTLITYARELKNMPGFAVVVASINGNQITLWGSYGLKNIHNLGYSVQPTEYKRIEYYKASKTWKLLLHVAEDIGGKITYDK